MERRSLKVGVISYNQKGGGGGKEVGQLVIQAIDIT
jgi:hypothetical protein